MITLYNPNGTTYMTLAVDDETNRQRELMGQHVLTVIFSLNSFVEFPVGIYCIMPDVFAEDSSESDSQRRQRLSRYTLYRKAQVTKVNERQYDYTLRMYPSQYLASLRKFRNVVINYTAGTIGGDNRLSFPLTATPKEHLQMVVDNLNKEAVAAGQTPAWSIGTCIDYTGGVDSGTEKLVSYDNLYIDEALAQMAGTFETEWYFEDKQVSLAPCEYMKTHPVIMSYGRANGFLSGVARQGQGDKPPIQRLFAIGGEQNINPSEYGKYHYYMNGIIESRIKISDYASRSLLLPYKGEIWYDGTTFYHSAHTGARHYIVSNDRLSIVNADDATYDISTDTWIEDSNLIEDSLDCTEIYPRRVGTLSRVEVEDAEHNLVDIFDGALSSDSFFQKLPTLTIGGEKPVIVFQSGNLAGREFDLHCTDNDGSIATSYVNNKGWKLQPVPAQIDGVWMPGGNPEDNYHPSGNTSPYQSADDEDDYTLNEAYMPAVGDQYAIFGIEMPWTYCDDNSYNGAEWDMFKKAAKYLYENEQEAFDFKGEVDAIWAHQRWNVEFTQPDGTTIEHGVGGYFRPGYHIFLNDSIIPNGILLRIMGVTDYPNKPYSPKITLSNVRRQTGFLTRFYGVMGQTVASRDTNRWNFLAERNRMRDTNEYVDEVSDVAQNASNTASNAYSAAGNAQTTANNAIFGLSRKADLNDFFMSVNKTNELVERANDNRTLFNTLSAAIAEWNQKQSRENQIAWAACIKPGKPSEIDPSGENCKAYKTIDPLSFNQESQELPSLNQESLNEE